MFTTMTLRTKLLLPAATLLALTGASVAASSAAMARLPDNPSVAPALAQDAGPATVGTVVHDASGSVLGTLVRLSDGGRTAVVETPARFFPGSRLVGSDQLRIPLANVAEAGGRYTVR